MWNRLFIQKNAGWDSSLELIWVMKAGVTRMDPDVNGNDALMQCSQNSVYLMAEFHAEFSSRSHPLGSS